MLHANNTVSVATWKDGKRFAYSITYDEGLVETAGFAWLIHRDYRIPGHINVFPHMLGQLVGDTSAGFLQSLWNLQKYAGPEQLEFLMSEGWSVGCQFNSADKTPTVESLREMRLSLEKAIGSPVRALAFPDFKSCQAHQGMAQEAGFDRLLAVYDDLNAADEDTNVTRRSPLYHRGPPPIRLATDPYRLLASARDRGGWVVDIVRLVDRYPLDPARDCTPGELEARFKAVSNIGGDQVWMASPETIARYRALRLSTRLQDYVATPRQISYTLAVTNSGGLTAQDELTFVVQLDSAWLSPQIIIADDIVSGQPGSDSGVWSFTHRVADGLQVRMIDSGGRSA